MSEIDRMSDGEYKRCVQSNERMVKTTLLDRKFTPESFYDYVRCKLPQHDKQSMISVIRSFLGESFIYRNVQNTMLQFIY